MNRSFLSLTLIAAGAVALPAIDVPFHPAQHGFRFGNQFRNHVGLDLHVDLDIVDFRIDEKITTKGRCGGMVFAALDYYYMQRRVPVRASLPPDGDAVADYILKRQYDSMIVQGPGFLERWAWQVAPVVEVFDFRVGPGRTKAELFQSGLDATNAIFDAISSGHPVPLGLVPESFSADGSHQVLAIGIDAEPNPLARRIRIYDPNTPAQVVTLIPDPANHRFVATNGKGWRTLFASFGYEPLNPPASGEPSRPSAFATVRGTTDLDVYWQGRDRGIGTTYTTPRVNNANWNTPFGIAPAGDSRPGSPVASVALGRDLYVFWFGPDGAIGATFSRDGGAWARPFPVTSPRSSRADSPLVAIARGANLDLFWIGLDGAVASTAMVDGRWLTGFPISAPGAAGAGSGLAAVAQTDRQLDVFWVAADGRIVTNWVNMDLDNNRWHSPYAITPARAARAASPVAAVSREAGWLDVFWIGPDGGIGTTYAKAFEPWATPFPIAPPNAAGAQSSLFALSRLTDTIDVFWVGPDSAIGSTANHGGGWATPFPVTAPGSARRDTPLTVVSRTPESLDLFWIGKDGALASVWWNSQANANNWSTGFPITGPGAANGEALRLGGLGIESR